MERIEHLKARRHQVDVQSMAALRRECKEQFDQLPPQDTDIFHLKSHQEKRELKLARAARQEVPAAFADDQVPVVPAPMLALDDVGAEAPGAQLAFVDADAGGLAVRQPPQPRRRGPGFQPQPAKIKCDLCGSVKCDLMKPTMTAKHHRQKRLLARGQPQRGGSLDQVQHHIQAGQLGGLRDAQLRGYDAWLITPMKMAG